MSPVLSWMFLGGLLLAAFGALFLWTRRIGNFGFVDVGWASAFTLVAAWFAAFGSAPVWRRAVLFLVVAAWSQRLAWHLGRRVARHHPAEDGRYVALRRAWAGALDLKMALFFEAQALSILVLAWPLFAIAQNPEPTWRAFELLGLIVVAVGIGGEATADRQLRTFKRRHADGSLVCTDGLWRYSRHPNYFFEWVVWVGFAIWAWPAPGGWAGVVSPTLMLYLLLRVTGVRYTEEQLERSKGEAYRRYRAATSAFVPWPPRSRATS